MFFYFASFILWLFGWKVIKGDFSWKSYVIIAAPHTSNWDFVLGRLGVEVAGIPQKVLMKKELFFWPLRYFLTALGAIPINRIESINMVDYIVKLFNENDRFVFSISPEGTRSFVDKWKTGFYHIANNAKVPLLLGRMDYKLKEIEFTKFLLPSGNFERDFEEIVDYFKNAKGKYPEKFNSNPSNLNR